jgi:hypothetical protein
MKIPALYGTRSFIAVFKADRRWSQSCVRRTQFTTCNPTSLRSVLILTYRQSFGLSSNALFRGFYQNDVCTCILSNACCMSTPTSISCSDHSVISGWELRLHNSSIFSCFLSRIASWLIVANETVATVLKGFDPKLFF